jgi:integrase
MASIRARSDNKCLFIDFRIHGERYREQTALKDTAGNRKKLQLLLDKLESEIAAGTFDYAKFFPNSRNAVRYAVAATGGDVEHAGEVIVAVPAVGLSGVEGTPLFKDFANTWFEEKIVEWRTSHHTMVKADIDLRLIPRWGDREVGKITKADILAYRAELGKVQSRGKNLSNVRINKLMNLLRQIINEAADRFNFRTPFQNIKQLKIKRTDVDPFSLDEVKLIIATVRVDYRNYFKVRFFTGMRSGEVHGLRWENVDFQNLLIRVRETFSMGRVDYTKNDSSQRDIQMSQVVYDALKDQEQATRSLGEYVFCNTIGKPLDNKNVVNRVWNPLLRHLKFKHRRAYQCRHTAATLWLAAGENPEWIAHQMGHTTTEMLFRVYSRYVPNLTRKDGSAFERLLLQTDAAGAGSVNKEAEVDHE